MMLEEIVAKFADALDQFEPINGQLSNTKIMRIWEVLATLLLHIPHDKTEVIHNLIVLIRTVTAYTTRYGVEFAKPACVRVYNTTIDDNATAVICSRMEAAHKAKRANSGTYETARRKSAQIILALIKDTWVRELRDPEPLYTDVAQKVLLDHLQSGCTGRHAINLLVLHKKIQHYHLKLEGIHEYIYMIEDAQREVGRAD